MSPLPEPEPISSLAHMASRCGCFVAVAPGWLRLHCPSGLRCPAGLPATGFAVIFSDSMADDVQDCLAMLCGLGLP